MTIDRVFLAFMAVCGTAASAVLVIVPQTRDLWIPPFYWMLLIMLCFEVAASVRGGGAPGTMISMGTRLLGLVIGTVLMMVLPMLAGSPGRLI